MSRLVLVTGATGHLGANLVRELLDRGHHVRALVRMSSNLSALQGLDVELVIGDLLDRQSLRRAMFGVEFVFHAGIPGRGATRHAGTSGQLAVEGTENVLREASRALVTRVVYTSSCVTIGCVTEGEVPHNEDRWNARPRSAWLRARVQAERVAWRIAEELDLDMVALCPTGVLGAHDYRFTPTTRVLRDIFEGSGAILPGGTNLVDVRDVAWAHAEAAERGRRGQRYLIGGENLTNDEIASLVGELTGRSPRVLRFPRSVVLGMAWVADRVAGVLSREPALRPERVRESWGRYAWFDCSKAVDELGLRPRPAREVLTATHQWLVVRELLA